MWEFCSGKYRRIFREIVKATQFGCLRKTKQFSPPIATSGNRRRNNTPFDRAYG